MAAVRAHPCIATRNQLLVGRASRGIPWDRSKLLLPQRESGVPFFHPRNALFLPPPDPLSEVRLVEGLLPLNDRVDVHDIPVAPGNQLVDQQILRRRDPDLAAE